MRNLQEQVKKISNCITFQNVIMMVEIAVVILSRQPTVLSVNASLKKKKK